MEVLKASQGEARLYAALALARIGAASKTALPQLLELAQHDDNIGVRVNAIIALGCIGAEPERVVPVLIEKLKDDQGAIQYAAILGLYRMGPAAKDAIPALTERVNNSTGNMKEFSRMAIDSLNGKRRPRPEPAQMAGPGMKADSAKMMMQMMKGSPRTP